MSTIMKVFSLMLLASLLCLSGCTNLPTPAGTENAVRAYSNDAKNHMESKEFEECIEDTEAALKLNAKYANGYYQRALCHIGLRQSYKAKEDFIKAAQLGHKMAQDLLTAKSIAW